MLRVWKAALTLTLIVISNEVRNPYGADRVFTCIDNFHRFYEGILHLPDLFDQGQACGVQNDSCSLAAMGGRSTIQVL